ncbi:MAG: TIGR04376 family protein [Leptolyngbyaceae bacterium]|nr:TIGR04376 family protein [Leptolyngbyaceae bacterium]
MVEAHRLKQGVPAMGLFEDLSKFLESRLEEFLRDNPHLELQALEEQLREQELSTKQLLSDLRSQEKKLQDEILETAQEIQRWHVRIEKAKAAGRMDLVKPAQEREAVLLRQGNQFWGQMQGLKDRIVQAEALQKQIQARRQEVKVKAEQAAAARASARAEKDWSTTGWSQPRTTNAFSGADPLEEQFRRWETQEELEQLKRKMGR